MATEDQYNEHYFLLREDGVKFRWTFVSHWSNVVSETGVVDRVKWLGGGNDNEEYIGHSSGFKYKKLKRTSERVYAWAGHLYDFESNAVIRGLTQAEEAFLVNNGTPFYVQASPVNGGTVKVSCITELKQVKA